MPLTPPGNSNRASAAHLLGTTSSVVLTQVEDTATVDLPNVRINGNSTNTAAAAGTGAVAVGGSTVGSGVNSACFGASATSSGLQALAFGLSSVASGSNSIAAGYTATASGINSISIGQSSDATASGAIAHGTASQATAINGIAIGNTANASAVGGVAIGLNSVASNTNVVSLGATSQATGLRSTAVGTEAVASATDAAVFGSRCTNALAASVALSAGTSNKLLHLCAPTDIAQLVSNNTGVTLDRPVGTITMFDDVNVGPAQFTFTNSYINANSIILLDPQGEPTHPVDAYVATRGAGSCVIDVIKNAASTPTVPAVIHYVVFNPT